MEAFLTALTQHCIGFGAGIVPDKSMPRLQHNLLAWPGAARGLSFIRESIRLLPAVVAYYELYAALRALYLGEKTVLTLSVPESVILPKSQHPWLQIRAGAARLTVLAGGALVGVESPPEPRIQSPRSWQVVPQRELIAYLARRFWGFAELKEGQYSIMERIFMKRNCLGILPTGAGKSLCFQLPAQVLPGITLVVSPLKSLMRDQYYNLTRAGIAGVEFLDSSKSAAEKRLIFAQLQAGRIKLLYISPERLQIRSFQTELSQALKTCSVSLLAIDEAHCISEWGHDFRPSYLRLRHFADIMGSPPVCALTATASNYVREDISRLLCLGPEDLVSAATLDRPEISLQVKAISGDIHQAVAVAINTDIPAILELNDIEQVHGQGAGVVFVPYADPQGESTRCLGTTDLARHLRLHNLDCRCYHSRLDDKTRQQVQDEFKNGSFPLLISTKGYGMGIDKADIDYVIHACAPPSLEAYYQEAGRAGRDQLHAHSLIITRPRLQKCIDKAADNPGEELPGCHNGWLCTITGKEKCDYGIQAGLLANEYPANPQIIRNFQDYLEELSHISSGDISFTYLCPPENGVAHLRYLYYLQELGAVAEFCILEYRPRGGKKFDILLHVELCGPKSLDNRWHLADKVAARIQTYKRQKLSMLDTVHDYIHTQTCRRNYLMNYFGDQTGYQSCNFCDIEGIDPGKAGVKSNWSRTRLLSELERGLAAETAHWLNDFVPRIEPGQEDIVRVRCLRTLEERPDNTAALALAGLYSLGQPKLRDFALRALARALRGLTLEQTDMTALMIAAAGRSAQDFCALTLQVLEILPREVLFQAVKLLPDDQRGSILHLALLTAGLEQINETFGRC